MMQKSLVLMALFAGAFANEGIKNRLGQASAKTLAQEGAKGNLGAGEVSCGGNLGQIPEVTLPECPCEFVDLNNLGLGQGIHNGFEQRAHVEQTNLLQSIPDSQFSQVCQSNCCACEDEDHASYTNAEKQRTFNIQGSITVSESVRFQEEGKAREVSEGRSQKTTVCQTNNAEAGLGAGNECITVSVCPPESNLGQGVSKGGKSLGQAAQ